LIHHASFLNNGSIDLSKSITLGYTIENIFYYISQNNSMQDARCNPAKKDRIQIYKQYFESWNMKRRIMVEMNVFLYGAGGHARVVIDILEQTGIQVRVVIDDNKELDGRTILGYPIRHTVNVFDSLLGEGIQHGIVAIGDNRIRQRQAASLIANGFTLITAIHPSAVISQHASVGNGTVVMANAVINPGCKIGDNVIINTGSVIDHDGIIEDAVHIAPGVSISGTVKIGERAMIGTGTSIINNVEIGSDAIIGAGAAVISDIPKQVKAVGVPAKVIHEF
jgi:sugar O-acyltransferase (sialic acid O-acetyltransferase NeuD family)